MPQNLPGFARCFTGNCISTGSLENPAGDQINMFPDILMNYINSTVQKNMFVFVFSFFFWKDVMDFGPFFFGTLAMGE